MQKEIETEKLNSSEMRLIDKEKNRKVNQNEDEKKIKKKET